MEAKKRGGRREGAGAPRKKREDVAMTRTIRVPDRLWVPAKSISENEGKTISKWIADLIQREIERREV